MSFNQKTIIVLLFVIFVIFSDGFSFIGWFALPLAKYMYYIVVAICFLSFFSLYIYNSKMLSFDINKRIVLFLIVVPLITVICKQILTNEPLNEERFSIKLSLSFLLYYALCYLKPTEKTLIKGVFIIGLTTLGIQLFQQSGDTVLFGLNDKGAEIFADTGEIYARNGILRFHVGTVNIALLLLYYYWDKIIIDFKWKYFVLFVVFCISMYLYVTRQYMLSTAVTLTLSILYLYRGKIQSRYLVVILIAVAVIYSNFDTLFGEFVKMTRTDTYSTDIRQQALPFILQKMVQQPLNLLVGYGHNLDMYKWGSNFGYWINDLGFIGETYLFGIGWFILYIATLFRIFFRYSYAIPNYLKLFVFGTMLHSVFVFTYRKPSEVFVWVIVLYLCNMYIQKADSTVSVRTLGRV